jgi:signal transduction histidine kinase
MGPKRSPLCEGRLLVVCLALFSAVLTAPAVTNQPLSRIVMVRVGGLRIPGPWSTNTSGPMSLRLRKPARIEISFGPVDSAADQPIRLLQKLEGFDTEWQEAGGQMQRPEMQLLVMLHDASYQMLSYRRFPMTSQSPGWNGQLETSEFTQQREVIVVPPGVERLQLVFTAENWSVLGSAALTGFRVVHRRVDGQEEDIWPDPDLKEGEDLDQPQGRPRFWQRGRIGARMAQVLSLPAAGHALVIKDDNVRMSATWQADLPLGDRVHSGDELTLQWREAFSVGIGERSRQTYEPLPPGKYVFRVKTITPFGEPIGSELGLTIFVPQTLWKRPLFFLPLILGSVALIGFSVWFIVNRRLQLRLNRLEQRRQMEHERLRIAQDIHDDLGASLTHINLLSQTVYGKLQHSDPARKDTERLRALTVGLTQKLDEIVWAVNPQHDTMESLFSYVTDFAEEFLAAAGIRARIQIPLELPNWALPSSLRHNVFLSAKEALNNAVKHGGASEVHLRLKIMEQAFELSIEDDGCGFVPGASPNENPSNRLGLEGMRSRMASIGGAFNLHSEPGQGTRVILRVPVRENAP